MCEEYTHTHTQWIDHTWLGKIISSSFFLLLCWLLTIDTILYRAELGSPFLPFFSVAGCDGLLQECQQKLHGRFVLFWTKEEEEEKSQSLARIPAYINFSRLSLTVVSGEITTQHPKLLSLSLSAAFLSSFTWSPWCLVFQFFLLILRQTRTFNNAVHTAQTEHTERRSMERFLTSPVSLLSYTFCKQLL